MAWQKNEGATCAGLKRQKVLQTTEINGIGHGTFCQCGLRDDCCDDDDIVDRHVEALDGRLVFQFRNNTLLAVGVVLLSVARSSFCY